MHGWQSGYVRILSVVFVPNFLQHVVINSHVLTRKHVQLVVEGFAFLGTGVASFDLQRTGRRTAFIDPCS